MMYVNSAVDLSIKFCGVHFENPFILAAAPPTDDLDMVREAFNQGWAGAVLKTTAVENTPVNLAYPMMSSIAIGKNRLGGMGNIDLISEHHIDVIEKRIGMLKNEFPDKCVIASISGSDQSSWQELARRTKSAGADLIECSFSCPQGTIGLKPGMMLAQSAEASYTVASWIKEAAKDTPVIIKLTPQVADIVEIADAIKRSGADAVCLGNSIPALMGVDLDSWVPYPNVRGKSTYSGLSGPAVKPISLKSISEVAGHVGISIAGSGGVMTWKDAVEFLLVGAGVVEFCTAVMHRGFGIIDDLKSGLSDYMQGKNIEHVASIIGKALPYIVSHDELHYQDRCVATIDHDNCIHCGACVIACRDGGHQAIAFGDNRKPHVDEEKCVGCALCASLCPMKCIDIKQWDEK